MKNLDNWGKFNEKLDSNDHDDDYDDFRDDLFPPEEYGDTTECPDCDGEGYIGDEECGRCNGEGDTYRPDDIPPM